MVTGDEAQLYTLEAVMAASIMLLVLLFAVEATSLTPLTSSAANVHVESQLQALGQDIFEVVDYAEEPYQTSELKQMLLNWNGTLYVWNTTDSGYVSRSGYYFNNNVTNVTHYVLANMGIAHNLEIIYLDDSGNICAPQEILWAGNPSDNAVIVSRKIAIHDSEINGTPLQIDVGMVDIDSTELYNVVDVRLTMWRM